MRSAESRGREEAALASVDRTGWSKGLVERAIEVAIEKAAGLVLSPEGEKGAEPPRAVPMGTTAVEEEAGCRSGREAESLQSSSPSSRKAASSAEWRSSVERSSRVR